MKDIEETTKVALEESGRQEEFRLSLVFVFWPQASHVMFLGLVSLVVLREMDKLSVKHKIQTN